MSISGITDPDTLVYDDFDRIVGDEKDPIVIEAVKRVCTIWGRDAEPWMRPLWGRCSHCGRTGRVLSYIHDMSSECSHCCYERILRELRAKEDDKHKEKVTRKFDLEDFTRI